MIYCHLLFISEEFFTIYFRLILFSVQCAGIIFALMFLYLIRSDMARSYRDEDSGDDELNQDSFYPPPTHSSRAHSSRKCKQCDRQKEVWAEGREALSSSWGGIEQRRGGEEQRGLV